MRYLVVLLAACGVVQDNGSDTKEMKTVSQAQAVWSTANDNPRVGILHMARLTEDKHVLAAHYAVENDAALGFVYLYDPPAPGAAASSKLIAELPDYVKAIAAGKTLIFISTTFELQTGRNKLLAYDRSGKLQWERELSTPAYSLYVVPGTDEVTFYSESYFYWLSATNEERLKEYRASPDLTMFWRSPVLRKDGVSLIPWSVGGTTTVRSCANMTCKFGDYLAGTIASDPVALDEEGAFAIITFTIINKESSSFGLHIVKATGKQDVGFFIGETWFSPLLVKDRIVMLDSKCTLRGARLDGRSAFDEQPPADLVKERCGDYLTVTDRKQMQLSGDKLHVLREYKRDGIPRWYVSVFDANNLTAPSKDYVVETGKTGNISNPNILSAEGSQLLVHDTGTVRLLDLVETETPVLP